MCIRDRSSRLKDEQVQLRATLEKDLKDSANDMAQLLASVAPRAMWDSDVPTLSEFARRAQRNPNVLFVIYDDATGQHLTRYLNRENPINKALLEKGQGERALDKVLDAAKTIHRSTTSKPRSTLMAWKSAKC